MIEPAIVLPKRYADGLTASPIPYGRIDVKWDVGEALALVGGFRQRRDGNAVRGMSDLVRSGHSCSGISNTPDMGAWYRVPAKLHAAGIEARRKSGGLPLDFFKEQVERGWSVPPKGDYEFVITQSTGSIEGFEVPPYAGWLLSSDPAEALLCNLLVVDEEMPFMAPLVGTWPLERLSGARVGLIGVGSIGSAAAEALADYGIDHLTLIDPDRLAPHNFARHRVSSDHVGRLKVRALANHLHRRDPGLQIDQLALDVILDADQMRPLFEELDLVVVSADGIDARRVANHLIRRAGKPGIFACVLEDGAFGEVTCTDSKTGCLLCDRRALQEAEGIRPETILDRGYGTGTRHLPMTAPGGDLRLVGDLAAKCAVATLLAERGYQEQRLPGGRLAVALQPKPGRRPPFHMDHAGEMSWSDLPPSFPDCPSCT